MAKKKHPSAGESQRPQLGEIKDLLSLDEPAFSTNWMPMNEAIARRMPAHGCFRYAELELIEDLCRAEEWLVSALRCYGFSEELRQLRLFTLPAWLWVDIYQKMRPVLGSEAEIHDECYWQAEPEAECGVFIEAVLDALAAGLSVEKAAKRFDVSEAEVREILRDEVERCRDGEHMREVWTLADRRLAAVELKFYNRAIEGDGDPQSAIVFVKTSERRATLAGANMPQSHVLQVVSTPPQIDHPIDRMNRVLDNICGVTPRERELEDQQLYSHEKLSIDEQAEFDQLRTEREAKREAERIARLGRSQGSEASIKPHYGTYHCK